MHSSIQLGSINGQPCRDTRTTQSMVHKDLVPDDSILDSIQQFRVHMEIPSTTPSVNIGGTRAPVKAAVSSILPQPALIGWDAPEFLSLLKPLSRDWNGQLSRY